MFVCEPCREVNKWPGIIPTSIGPCEVCNQQAYCYDIRPPAPPLTDVSSEYTIDNDNPGGLAL